jgi:hypothetical protein
MAVADASVNFGVPPNRHPFARTRPGREGRAFIWNGSHDIPVIVPIREYRMSQRVRDYSRRAGQRPFVGIADTDAVIMPRPSGRGEP